MNARLPPVAPCCPSPPAAFAAAPAARAAEGRGWRGAAALLALVTALVGCGGGGSDAASAPSPAPAPPPAAAPAPAAAPIATIRVGIRSSGRAQINTPLVDVTLCTESGVCQTVTNVLVDTGSAGLRLSASALDARLLAALSPVSTAAGALHACAPFASGTLWGALWLARVQVGGAQTQQAIPVQVYDDALRAAPRPDGCSARGPDLAASLAATANGILGIDNFRQDCGPTCAARADTGFYFTCRDGLCSPSTAELARQTRNPVSAFAPGLDDGHFITLPGVPLPNGLPSVEGTLRFGLSSAEALTRLASAQLYPLDARGQLGLSLNGTSARGFIDSGSNGYFLDLPGLPVCSQRFYCPPRPVEYTVRLRQSDAREGPALAMVIADAQAAALTGNKALPALGGTAALAGLVDLGLPLFYGRSLATGLEGRRPDAPTGFVAF